MRPDDHLVTLVDSVHAELVDRTDADRTTVAQIARTHAPLATAAVIDAVVGRVLARAVGLGPLEPLLVDADITEVMVNGPGLVWVERGGAVESTDVCLDRAAIELLVERIVAPLGLRADRTSPLVDARLPDGSRVNVIIPLSRSMAPASRSAGSAQERFLSPRPARRMSRHCSSRQFAIERTSS